MLHRRRRMLGAVVAIAMGAMAFCIEASDTKSEVGSATGRQTMKAGDTLTIAGRRVLVREMDVTPVVRNEYSEVHSFARFDDPALAQLREEYDLPDVVAQGKDEFDRQVILMDWVYNRFKKFGRPTSAARGALGVLQAADEGHTFFCAHYGDAMVGTSAALGWISRPIALRTYKEGPGSTEHTTTEIWSNQWRKWIMFDPTYALYIEKDGEPLNAYEIRQEWIYKEGRDLVFIIGAERKRYRKDDMPIFRAHHPGFGDLALRPATMDKYAFLGYIPNNKLADSGPNYLNMFITKDAICDGVRWHKRKNPADPAHEPYFPLNQADLSLAPADGLSLSVGVDTMTPNFAKYRYRIDGGEWQDGEPGTWALHDGANSLEVVSVNKFGVQGVPSKATLDVQ